MDIIDFVKVTVDSINRWLWTRYGGNKKPDTTDLAAITLLSCCMNDLDIEHFPTNKQFRDWFTDAP